MNTDLTIRERLNASQRLQVLFAKFAIGRIGYQRWDIISKNTDTSDIDLWREMYAIGKRLLSHDKSFAKTSGSMDCNDEIYQSIRRTLIEKKILKEASVIDEKSAVTSGAEPVTGKKKKKPKKGAVKKMKAADRIRQENIEKHIQNEMKTFFKDSSDYKKINETFHSKFDELMLVRMMIYCREMINQYRSVLKRQKALENLICYDQYEIDQVIKKQQLVMKKMEEMIVGFNKIVDEKTQKSSVSRICLGDIQGLVNEAKLLINFNPYHIVMKRPELVFKTVYDKNLMSKLIDLYPSQKEIFRFIEKTEKFLALIHTMLGAGKTSMVLPICGMLSNNHKANHTKLVFCCPNEVVLLEVAHMVYGLGISFGIVYYDQETDGIKYSWSSFTNKKDPHGSCILYLCDVYSATILMRERLEMVEKKKKYMKAHMDDPVNYPLTANRVPQVPDYILMADELTKDADSRVGFMVDSGFSITTERFVDLMKVAPPKTMVMSATLPTYDQMPVFYHGIANNHPGMVIKSFSSSEARIGCALHSANGELYAPHCGCKTVEEVKKVIEVIQNNPFIGRFYTFEVLIHMVEIFTELDLETPDLSVMFEDPSKANQSNIQQTAYQMLEQLIHLDDCEMIERACQINKHTSHQFDLNRILTSDIGHFSKNCLIFSSDPISSALAVYHANFDNFLTKTDRDIFQQIRLDVIMGKYQREIDAWEKAKERIENKSDDGCAKQNKMNDTKERVMVDTWQRSSNLNDKKPKWDFPAAAQICSTEHLIRCECNETVCVGSSVEPEDLPEKTSVSNEILTMLASGVGIYTTNSDLLDDDYLKTVLFLAKKGKVRFIFTDSSIAYGTNLAVTEAIVIDEPVESINTELCESITSMHSMKTIFQMLGRAGRGGKLSYQARIYTTSANNELINKIHAYIQGELDEGEHDEIVNIQRAFDVLW